MSLLQKLTIVIPTYNRPQYALRNMHYWMDSEVTVHVLDGTDQSISPGALKGLSKNINYYHLPIPFSERITKALDLVQTEYALLLGDDEFFLPSGLEAAIAELEADNDLVACMGRCIAFQQTNEGIVSWPDYTEMEGYSLVQDDPAERMVAHMNNYTCSTIYAVVRTPVWITAMSVLPKEYFTLFAVEECQFEMIISFLGKSKVIPQLVWLRSKENEGAPQDNARLPFHRWWKSHKKIKERSKYIDLMTETLFLATKLDRKKIKNSILQASEAFAEWSVKFYKDTLFESPVSYIGIRLPRVIKRPLKKFLGFISPPTEEKPVLTTFVQAAQIMKAEGVHVNFNEIDRVVSLLEDFHNVGRNK